MLVFHDYTHNAFLAKIKASIPNNQVVLTNGEIYDPATLVGKKTFVGRLQYIYVYGGYAEGRGEIENTVLLGGKRENMIHLLQKNNLHYAVFYKNNFAKNEKPFNEDFYNNTFTKVYENADGVIYKI